MNLRLKAKKTGVNLITALLLISSLGSLARAQVTTTSRINGSVADQQGAVVSSAQVVVKNNESTTEYKPKVGEDGTFVIASLPVGTYTITVTAAGFKQTVVTNVKTDVGTAATVSIVLEVGAASEMVTVTSGAEVLQKETTSVGAVLTGRQIIELPMATRNALDQILSLPGTATTGRSRSSSVNGLPKGALNISIDGINVQDNTLRSTDGFFAFIGPRIDTVEEVQVSTATPGAEASAGGAVHVRFVTKAGTNEYHGGAWWYNRQRAFNSNYYFNNLTGTPRAQVMLNQLGFKVGGPITPWLKDRAFFFASWDEYRLPEQQVRTRTILSPEAMSGIFRYAGGPANGVNLFSLAASKGFLGTVDPTIATVLSQIRASTAVGAVNNSTDPNLQLFTFANTGGQIRHFPTTRIDYNLNSKNHIEAIYNYQDFNSKVDFLNNRDPVFPSPVPQIFGSQGSNRFSLSLAVRSQLSATIVNEGRFGLTGGTVVFFPETSAASFAPFGGIAPAFPGAAGNTPYSGTTTQRRNAPIEQFTDNLSWSKGKHNFNFGGDYNRGTNFVQTSGGALVQTVSFGIDTADPANALFSAANFPGASTTTLANARAIYGLLIGRVNGVTFNSKIDEKTKHYSLDGQPVERNKSLSYGLYFQDYYKLRPNLTVNYGVRWEPQLAPVHLNEIYTRPTFGGLFGISGPGNLFNPGATAGAVTTYVPVTKDTKPYKNDMNNVGPSLGFAWSPHSGNSLLKHIFGEGDQTVIRASYAISYVTGGFADFTGVWNSNPGLTKFNGLRAGIDFQSGAINLRNGLPPLPTPTDNVFPLASQAGISANDFDPNLHTPYVQSWSFGIQREIDRNTVFEARYVGNHSIGLIRTVNLNEVNIFESGFLPEFIAAQNNLAVSVAAGRGSNFRNQGLSGQVNLPIITASFGSPTSTLFANTTFLNLLTTGQAGVFAATLGNSSANFVFQTNRIAAGLPANLFTVNPSVYGAGSNLQSNMDSSMYNGLQLEVRRRLSKGLLLNANYTFSKSLATNFFGQPHTLRNLGLDKTPSNFDITQAFKVNYIYELPFGPGQKWDFRGPGGVVGKLLEGWSTDGVIRLQSGRVFSLASGRGTVNNVDAGVVLVGMSTKELQSLISIRKQGTDSVRGTVYWLPQDIVDNTLRAFGLLAGTPTGRYIAPPTEPGKFGNNIFLHGPKFFRADLSIGKRTRITERTNVEFRAEFLNAFNNTNFFIGALGTNDFTSIGVNSLTFGQTNVAFTDQSGTNDPGGRLIQLVLRVNF